MSELDPRRHAFRPGLAAAGLEGRVEVARFVAGAVRQVRAVRLPVKREPRHDAPLDTEVLFGETVTVYDEAEGWAWAQLDRDGYVGYLPAADLAARAIAPTHWISEPMALVYAEASALSLEFGHLSFNSPVSVTERVGDFARLATGGFVGARYLTGIGALQSDYVASALAFLGTPYLYGGKSSFGIDCSGLVQNVLQAAGLDAPRDSDMQFAEVGPKVAIGDDLSGLERGDVVFWPGHVGLMIDAARMVHASATNMKTAIEDVTAVAARSRKDGPIVAGVARPRSHG